MKVNGFTPHHRQACKSMNELNEMPKGGAQRIWMSLCGAGFTLVEMMVVVAIIGIMVAIVGGNYQGARQRARLEDEAQKVVGMIEEARSNAVAAKEGRRYGVELGGGQYSLFSLDDNDVASSPLKSESLPSSMDFSSGRVVFGKLTGVPETTPTINLEDERYYIEIKVTQADIKKEKIKLQE